MTRRSFWPAAGSLLAGAAALNAQTAAPRKGRLKQSVTRGCFGRGMSFEQMCQHAARLGIRGFDLIGPQGFDTLKENGLVPSMVPSASTIPNGINRIENHAAFEADLRDLIPKAVAAGAPNIIVLTGSSKGLTDEEGIANCVTFLNRVKGLAEDHGITLCMELLNTKVNHPGYQCNHTAWGVEVCKRVNSPRVKLLYDIYHMQIMEGDVIATIRANAQWIAHFHTAGVPGRHELDGRQELNYGAIAQAIVDTGFTGYLAHEYNPTRDPLTSLEEAIRTCDV
ncbi:MAG TPA: TIM barrel protein [Bryobacteraceae bacterium]|nr:TIM barrel protein [Bryobacteraceae bacterium]